MQKTKKLGKGRKIETRKKIKKVNSKKKSKKKDRKKESQKLRIKYRKGQKLRKK